MDKQNLKELFQIRGPFSLSQIIIGIVVLVAGIQLWADGVAASLFVVFGSLFLVACYAVVSQGISFIQDPDNKDKKRISKLARSLAMLTVLFLSLISFSNWGKDENPLFWLIFALFVFVGAVALFKLGALRSRQEDQEEDQDD